MVTSAAFFAALRRVLFLVLVLPAIGGAAVAPQSIAYDWQNVRLGGGGFAPGIVFSPAEQGLAYLRTDMGGAYRWEESAARWVPLQDGMADSSLMGIESIAPDPVDPDRLYVAAGMHARGRAAMLRSDNRGATWDVVDVPFAMGGNEPGRGLGERLAVDSHAPTRLLFGSRHDGMWGSDDRGKSWHRVAGFPYRGQGAPQPRETHAGVAFVVFDARADSRRAYAGIADSGEAALMRSDDGGESWRRVPGGPRDLLPVKASLDSEGRLYIAYANGIGPGEVTDGAVFVLEADGTTWRDVTPRRSDEGGYNGIAADPNRPGHVIVSTFNRWQPGDTVWETTDGGRRWTDLRNASHRDTRVTPFLNWGQDEAEFGHWIAGLAIDPFDSRRAAYTTGATMYVTHDLGAARLTWTPWTLGIEQTAVITMVSPTGGAHLVSGFGDLGGFVHDDFAVSPPTMHLDPRHSNTNTIDYAGRAPEVLVRSGNVHRGQAITAGLGVSIDGGHHWTPLRTSHWSAVSLEANGMAPITVNADGSRIFVGAETTLFSDDAKSWSPVAGVPANSRIVTDKVDPKRAWTIDFDSGRLLASSDGGRSFAPIAAGGSCPDLAAMRPRNREAQSVLVASPFAAGELYLQCGGGLYRSTDGGARFDRVSGEVTVDLFGLGKGAPGGPPALYVIGARDGATAVLRSIDGGARWDRINDDAHRWGHRFRAIIGDPRIFGRVYIATDGRGIVYGDPVAAKTVQ